MNTMQDYEMSPICAFCKEPAVAVSYHEFEYTHICEGHAHA